jgi:hypothetical protein
VVLACPSSLSPLRLHSLLGTLVSWTQSERGSFFAGLEETVLFRTVCKGLGA